MTLRDRDDSVTDTSSLGSRELAVVDRRTGEVLDLAAATDDQLAGYLVGAREVAGDLRAAERAVMDELIARFDREGRWTATVEGYKLSAPSPQAGLESYHVDLLREALGRLVDGETITPDAAARALQRTVTLTVEVSWGDEPAVLAFKLNDPAVSIEIAGVPVSVVSASHVEKPILGQLKNLRKIPGVADVLDAALADAPARPRTVTVKETP